LVAILALVGLGVWWVLEGNRGAAFATLPETELPAEVSPSTPYSASGSGLSVHAEIGRTTVRPILAEDGIEPAPITIWSALIRVLAVCFSSLATIRQATARS
jgi:hypothetical protein